MKTKKAFFQALLFCAAHMAAFMLVQMLVLSAFAMSVGKNNMPQALVIGLILFNCVYIAGIALLNRLGKKPLIPARRGSRLGLPPYLCAVAAGFLFSFGYDGIMAFLLPEAVPQSMAEQTATFFTMGIPAAVAATLILQPISEELLFRGILLHRLEGAATQRTALLVSAVLFALLHIPAGVILLPVTFLGGLLFGYIKHKTGRLLPAVLAHAAANVSGFISHYWAPPKTQGLVLGISCLLLFSLVLYYWGTILSPSATNAPSPENTQ